MRKIYFYEQDGRVHDEQDLTGETLFEAIGMMARCFLSDGSCHEGFICFTPGIDIELQNKDYGSTFFLWTWAHLDEDTNQLVGDEETKYEQNYEPIDLLDVLRIDAILFSNPRWGGLLCNHFFIDTRPYLAFDEIQHIFKNIWCSGYEKHWYRNAWNILGRKERIRYTTERERCEVLLRGVAISMIYEDFCKVYRGEDPSYGYLNELEDDIPELVLGQLYGAKYPEAIEEDPSAAIFRLANDIRPEIVSILRSKMSDLEILAHLICTIDPPTTVDEDGDEIALEFENFGDYINAVKLFQTDRADSIELSEAAVYSWIDAGMPLACS